MERDLKKELERGREWKRVMKGKLLSPSSEFCVLMIPLHVALIPSIITSISSPPSLYTHPSLQFPFYPSPSHPYYFASIPHPPSQIFPLYNFLPSYSISLPIHTTVFPLLFQLSYLPPIPIPLNFPYSRIPSSSLLFASDSEPVCHMHVTKLLYTSAAICLWFRCSMWRNYSNHQQLFVSDSDT